MFPRWHILYGFIFSALVWIVFPEIVWYNIFLIFFASVFIDFDHYIIAVWRTGKFSLFSAFEYYRKLDEKALADLRKGIRLKKADFQVFHTIEIHALVLGVGLSFIPFIYLFIGMFFHSLLDIFEMQNRGVLYTREFLFVNWIRQKIKSFL